MAMTDAALTRSAPRSTEAERARALGWLPSAPVLILIAVLIGLAAVLLTTPIAGRGDYGQWLMTSRWYLGQSVPDYRTVTALPPAVPLTLAAIQLFVRDAVAALQLMNVVLMAGLALSLYAVGTVLGRGAIVGVLAVAIGLLVTDRYLELFAFGGLLQASAVMWTAFTVAAFARGGRGPGLERQWWFLGSATLALAALSHVGAGTVAVPTGLAVAGLSLFRLRGLGWPVLRHALVPVFIGLLAIGVYWLIVLLPASRDYVTNPASLGYRGPERLMSALFDFWPTGMVILVGFVTVAVGSLAELLARAPERFVTLLVWTAVAWGSLAWAILTGASTDFPRFAPVLLAPLVVASAFAVLWMARSLGLYLHGIAPRSRPTTWVVLSTAVLVVAAVPFAVERYQRQALTYQPRDAAALQSAVAWIDATLPAGDLAVLAAVRDGKWLEGATGREALFSLPVRYAFRPTEWQRSIDAEALLRSTAAATNEFFFVKFTEQLAGTSAVVPVGMLVAVNHGGEFVELLRLAPGDTRLTTADGSATTASLTALGSERRLTENAATIRTDWSGMVGTTDVALTRLIRLTPDGATLELVDRAPGTLVETTLGPPSGMAITSVEVAGREARLCFTRIGASEPCVRVFASQPAAVLETTESGSLRINAGGPELNLLVTALTPSGPSVHLGLLDPDQLVRDHQVGAALLVSTDPAFSSRQARLETLGFELGHMVGPYAVMVRTDLFDGARGP
jgi:hypothetical protein